MADPARLDSWKEIAAYLGRDVRTVIRWEARRGMPVHRVPGGKVPRVFAYAAELDQWLASGAADANGENHDKSEAAPDPPAADQSRPWLAALGGAAVALLVVGAGAALWAWSRPSTDLSRVEIAGNQLRALDLDGRTQWTYVSGAESLGRSTGRWNYIGDIDGDRRAEVVTALDLRRGPTREYGGELRVFDADGTRRWGLRPDDSIEFRGGQYTGPWPTSDVGVHTGVTGTRIIWALHHFTWWPGLLITTDAMGARVGTFVNSGWIRTGVQTIDARHIVVAGVSNSRQTTFAAILDAANPSGRSPEPPGSEFECLTCPDGFPLQYFALPRTDVARQHPFPTDGPSVMRLDNGIVQIQALESGPPNFATVIYDLEPTPGGALPYRLRQARFGDAFWEWHRRLEADGRLTHTVDVCPERRGLVLERWTPSGGWETQTIAVR